MCSASRRPPRECLEWHIKPNLKAPRASKSASGSYRALCPAHDDGEHSLGVSLADSAKKRIVWNCFACKNRVKVRLALIRKSASPPAACRSQPPRRRICSDRLYRIATADTTDHGVVRFSIVAALEGYRELPPGARVDRIAGLAHVHRATGYRAQEACRAAGLQPLTPVPTPPIYSLSIRPLQRQEMTRRKRVA